MKNQDDRSDANLEQIRENDLRQRINLKVIPSSVELTLEKIEINFASNDNDFYHSTFEDLEFTNSIETNYLAAKDKNASIINDVLLRERNVH